MSLGFLSPAGLLLLLGLPLLVLPYLLRRRYPRVVVPALFFYRGLSSGTRRRPWGSIRLSPLFFLELLILVVLVAAAGRPVLRHAAPDSLALLLDTSASMQAHGVSGDVRLFELAKDELRTELAERPADGRVGVYTTNPLGPASAAGAERAVDRSAVSDAPDPSDAALSGFLSRLLTERGYRRVIFFTDRSVVGLADDARVRVVTLGPPRPNLGIRTFRVYRSPFFPDEVQASVGIGGATDSLPAWQLVVEDGRSGRRVASQPAEQAERAGAMGRADRSGGTQDAGTLRPETVRTFSFSDLPPTDLYRARVVFDTPRAGERSDGLLLDNEAVAVLPRLETVSVLLVSPTPEVGDSLAQIPNLRLTRLPPEEYDPAAATHAGLTCILFHLTTPDVLPTLPAAFFLPPQDNPLFGLGDGARRPRVTDWTLGHPLTAYLSFPLLAPMYAQALRPSAWNLPVVESTAGPLVLAGEQAGRRYVVTGFDVLPYLGHANLPVSILTLNILSWLADTVGGSSAYPTGTVLHPPIQLRFPDQEQFRAFEEAVVLDRQGVYRLRENGVERLLAVNLMNTGESTPGKPLRLDIDGLAGGSASEAAVDKRLVREWPVWPWLLLAALGLCGVEWWWAARFPQGA